MRQNKIRVALYMAHMSVPEKLKKSKRVEGAILGNPSVFVSPGTALSDMTNAAAALETAWNNTEDGGKSLTAIMRNKEELFDAAMLQLAIYVELTAAGDPEVIYLAGLDVRPLPATHAQANFEAKHGNGTGLVQLKTKAVKGVSYDWQYSNDNVNWADAGASLQSRKMLEGLSPGTRYWFRFAVIDKNGQQPWSESVSLIVV
jgi:hypothetical protein